MKLRRQGRGWWVPGDDIVRALRRAMCTDLLGAAENSDLVSCD
jgi:hypothetical protein